MAHQTGLRKKEIRKPLRGGDRSRRNRWIGAGLIALTLIVGSIFFWYTNAIPFEFVGGDEAVLVLLREEAEGHYTLRYTGDDPGRLERLLPILEARVLHVGVGPIILHLDGRDIELEDGGYLPEGEEFDLQPGQLLEFSVIYTGQTLGAHRVLGFRLRYDIGRGIVEKDLEIDGEFGVFIE